MVIIIKISLSIYIIDRVFYKLEHIKIYIIRGILIVELKNKIKNLNKKEIEKLMAEL